MKRKRGNGKSKPERPSVLGAKEAFLNVGCLNVDHIIDTVLDDFRNTEFDAGMEAETPLADFNSQEAGLEKQVANGRTEDNVDSLRKLNIPVLGNLSKKAGSITTKSSRGLSSPSINVLGNATLVQGERTCQEEPRLPHQDPRYKDQELNASLSVIKKIMKMDAAEPFNVPVDPIALGLPDYFDIINTPMDFGTICNYLENGLKYMNSEDVFKDVQYIWENCCKYNKKGGYILVLMKLVKTKFMKYWAAAGLYMEQPQAINAPVETTVRHSKRKEDCTVGPVTDNHGNQKQDKVGSSQVRYHQPSPIYSQASQPKLSSNQPQPSLQQTVTNIGIVDSTSMKRRTRGPTRCLKVWNREGRISIATNELGQPIGPEAPKLTNFLGTLARDGLMAPLTYVDWRAIPDANKEKMWQQVQSKFDIDPKCKSWVLKSLGDKWKNWRSKLKVAHYDIHETDEERLADCDERVLPDQWSILISYWNSKDWEKRSATNKANRALQKFNHTTGSKSFARLREEQRSKRPDGKEPSQAEFFVLTRTRKDGRPLNEASSTVISQLRECTSQQQNLQNCSRPQDDIFFQVMGLHRRGRVRTYGLGPSPSDLGVPNPTRSEAMRMVSEANAEVHMMKERMVTMEQTCAQMAVQMDTMMSMMSSMQKTIPDKHWSNIIADTPSEGLPQQQVHSSISRRTVPPRETSARKKLKMQNASTGKVT